MTSLQSTGTLNQPAHQASPSPLRVPDYRRLLSSNTLWWQAMWMEMIVIGWLVLELTNSAWQVSLIGFYRMAPLLVLGFFSGTITDRFGRRRIIIASQTVNVTATGAIALLLWFDLLAFWHIAVAAVVLGTTWAMDWTARRSLIPDLVGRARTMDAMLLEGVTQNITRILGPFTAGALIEALGAKGCYAVLTCVSASALLMLLRLSKLSSVRPADSGSDSPWTRMIEGFSYVRRNPAILGTFLITVAMNFFVFPYMGLLPVFARDVLGQGPFGLGILGAATGVGSFLGLLIVNLLRNRVPITRIYYAGSFLMACAVVAFARSTSFDLSFALLVVSGVGQACFGILQSSIVLLSANDAMRSRAMGAIVLGIGAGPPGRLQIGALAEAYGAPLGVTVTSVAAALAVIAVVAALPGFRRASGQEEQMEA